MKAISMWQPWASLWLSPRKIHETRHWPTKYRGWLLVHAAKRFEKNFDYGELPRILRAEFGETWFRDLPTGAIIGAVELIGCFPTETVYPTPQWLEDDFHCGDHKPGRFAWRRGDYQRFEHPIPYRGAQGFFTVDDRILPDVFVRKSAA